MKLPFAGVIGPPLKRYTRFYNRLCAPKVLGQNVFVVCLGILGTCITLMDIARILMGGPVLSDNIWRTRMGRRTRDKPVSPEVERDLKLMACVLAVEHFTLMILGAITDHPALLLPWLLMEALVIVLEAMMFVSRVAVEGIHLNRANIFVTALMLHNWLQVFCLFKKQISMCDL